MITILAIISALIVTFLFGMFLMCVFNIKGAILGFTSEVMTAFLAIEFYKLFT